MFELHILSENEDLHIDAALHQLHRICMFHLAFTQTLCACFPPADRPTSWAWLWKQLCTVHAWTNNLGASVPQAWVGWVVNNCAGQTGVNMSSIIMKAQILWRENIGMSNQKEMKIYTLCASIWQDQKYIQTLACHGIFFHKKETEQYCSLPYIEYKIIKVEKKKTCKTMSGHSCLLIMISS